MVRLGQPPLLVELRSAAAAILRRVSFVKALSKILRAGQAPSVTIPRTSHRFGPLAYLRDVRNCVFRQL